MSALPESFPGSRVFASVGGSPASDAQSILEPSVVEIADGSRHLAVVRRYEITIADAAELAHQFPEADPGLLPCGNLILVQIQAPQDKTRSGLILADETKQAQQWNEMTARVIALGPLAYVNPNDGQPYIEGPWCKPGDFVRVPKYGGDRHQVDLPDGRKALFVVCKDREVISKVTGNPLSFRNRI